MGRRSLCSVYFYGLLYIWCFFGYNEEIHRQRVDAFIVLYLRVLFAEMIEV
jgi:hypothetical protein